MALVRVAVPIPLAREESLVYEIPEDDMPEVGLRVLVPGVCGRNSNGRPPTLRKAGCVYFLR